MIKSIIKFFKNYYDSEYHYEFELEFSVYDLIAGVILVGLLLWWFLK